MAIRTYFTIGDSEEKIYLTPKGHEEFVCDVCDKDIPSEVLQVHLTLSGKAFMSGEGAGGIRPFNLDLHTDCISQCGIPIFKALKTGLMLKKAQAHGRAIANAIADRKHG